MVRPVYAYRKRLPFWLLWLAIYFAAGKLGLQFATVNPSATPFWPPTGIALAALLMEGLAAWPVVFAGAFLVNVTTAGGLMASLGIALGNTLEAVIAAQLLNQFAGGIPGIWRANGVKFAGAVGVASLFSASIGVSVLCLGHLAAWSDYGRIWFTWWLGDVTGAIIFAPFVITWFGSPREEHVRPKPTETMLFVLVCLSLTELVFGSQSLLARGNYSICFLWIPPLIWVGFRFGLRGSTAMTILLCPLVIWQTLHGLGPFVRDNPNESLLLAQAFDATLVLTSIGVAAIVGERTEMACRLLDAHASAERQVEERTAALTAANQTLQQAQGHLEYLSARLLRAQDDERRRVARELHDSSGQLAAALSIELDKLRAEEGRLSPAGVSSLLDVAALSAELSREIRTLSYLLHPPLLDEFGLAAAVRWYAEGFAKRSGVAVDLHLDDNLGRLAGEIETAAFRIVQECLTNVHLHSGSTLAVICIERTSGGALRIQVADNGKGIGDPDRVRPGVGISGMRERVRTLEGELRIDSAPQGGTTITAIIPVVLRSQAQA
jgi:signal transduction histidine kinase